MAVLTISIGGLSSSKTISAADMTRLLAAYTTILTTTVNGVPSVPTNQQLVDRFTASIVQGMADTVRRYEQDAARATAEAGVSVVVVT